MSQDPRLETLSSVLAWDGKSPFPVGPVREEQIAAPPLRPDAARRPAKATAPPRPAAAVPAPVKAQAAPPVTPTAGAVSAPDPLPANIDTEKALLGAVMIDNADYERAVKAGIVASDFALDSHRKIWLAITATLKDGNAANIVTLPATLEKRKQLGAVGGVAYLASLSEGVPFNSQVADFVRIIKDYAGNRDLIRLADAIRARVEGRIDTPAQIAAQAAEELTALADGSGSGASLRLLKGSDIEEQDQPMVLPGHIPDHTAITINARPGDGKSTVASLICADLSQGKTPYSGSPCPERNVLFLTNEDSPSRIRQLFAAAGGNVDRLWVEDCGNDFWQLSELPRLEEAIRKNSIGVAVIDSLASHSGKADLNSHQETMRMLVPLRSLAERNRLLLVVIHHLNKSLSVDHVNKMAGSVGIVAAFRHNLHVCVDPENADQRLLLNGKSNLLPPNAPALRFKLFPVSWAGQAHISIDDIYRVTEPDERPGKAAAWLREALSDGEWHLAGQLQQQAKQGFNLSTRSLFRAADTLRVERRKAGFGGRAEWRLRSAGHETEPAEADKSAPENNYLEVEA